MSVTDQPRFNGDASEPAPACDRTPEGAEGQSGRIAERRAEIVRLTKAGHSAAEIAKRLGVTTRTVHRQRRTGGCAKPMPNWMTDDEIRRAEALLDDGASYSEVARTLGRTAQSIGERFPGRGYSKAQANEMRRLKAQLEAL